MLLWHCTDCSKIPMTARGLKSNSLPLIFHMQSLLSQRQAGKDGSPRTQKCGYSIKKKKIKKTFKKGNTKAGTTPWGQAALQTRPSFVFRKKPCEFQAICKWFPHPNMHCKLLQSPGRLCNVGMEIKPFLTFNLGVIFSYDLLILFEFCWRRHVFFSKKKKKKSE